MGWKKSRCDPMINDKLRLISLRNIFFLNLIRFSINYEIFSFFLTRCNIYWKYIPVLLMYSSSFDIIKQYDKFINKPSPARTRNVIYDKLINLIMYFVDFVEAKFLKNSFSSKEKIELKQWE